MSIENFPTWNRLVALASRLAVQFSCSPGSVWGQLGLYLYIPPKNHRRCIAPSNITEFARSGGDSVEFSFIGSVSESSPILMNVPCSDERNVIVGENLLDFLSLGCLDGFFGLEQLVYQYDQYTRALDNQAESNVMPQLSHEPALDKKQKTVLSALRSEFQLNPWTDHHAHLQELKRKHFEKLIF
ncbi:hypothetical protein BH09VER1_BH09VER1_55830 [soil metagenome]